LNQQKRKKMYSLKVKKGTKLTIRNRSGFSLVIDGNKEYTQAELKSLHESGADHWVVKSVDEKGLEKKTKKGQK
jgi:hypothetical protein